jgi:hypothetical protein
MTDLLAWPFPLPERFTEPLGYERARWYLGEKIAPFVVPGWRPARQAASTPVLVPGVERDPRAGGSERHGSLAAR